MASAQEAEGYLLLTLPDTTVSQSFDGESMPIGKGELAIECVQLPISPEIGHQTANPFASSPNDPPQTHDLWLVLRVGDDFEHTLVPGNPIEAHSPPGGDGGPRYILREPAVPGAELVIQIEAPKTVTDLEDMGTLEALLHQYGVLEGSALDGLSAPVLGAGTAGISYGNEKGQPPGYSEKQPGGPGAGVAGAGLAGAAAGAVAGTAAGSSGQVHSVPPLPDKQPLPTSQVPPESPIIHGGGDLRGHLVLVDEQTGAVLGQLDTQQQDLEHVVDQDPTRPVLVDFGPIIANTRTVNVTRIPPEELDDWLLRGADTLSRGILAIGSKGSAAMMSGANSFKKRTVPRPKPVTFGATTKSGFKNVHSATTKSAAVTGKTVNMINHAVQRVVEGRKNPQAQAQAGQAGYGSTAPKQSTFSKLKDQAMPAVAMLKEKAGYASTGSSTATPQGVHGTTSYGAGAGAPGYSEKPGQQGQYGQQGQHSQQGQYGQPGGSGLAPPALPARPGSPGKGNPPGYAGDSAYSYEKGAHGAAPLSPGASGASTPLPRKKRGFLNRSVLAADAVLSSLEAAASDLVTSGTSAASSMAQHRYGADAGEAVAYAGSSVRNAVLVYVDVRGVGRRGVLKATAKGWVKARLKSGETVALQPVPAGTQPGAVGQHAGAGQADVIINVPQASEKATYRK